MSDRNELADAFEAYEPQPEDEGKASSLMALRLAAARRAEADRGSMDGTAVWPNDSEGHDVKFHVGTGTVVCTCGAYFESERFNVTLPRSAVSLWAEHVRRTRDIPPTEEQR